ncbi:MAG: hypothetical protein V7607_5595 [Solirubrobacteraceae bacterium]
MQAAADSCALIQPGGEAQGSELGERLPWWKLGPIYEASVFTACD